MGHLQLHRHLNSLWPQCPAQLNCFMVFSVNHATVVGSSVGTLEPNLLRDLDVNYSDVNTDLVNAIGIKLQSIKLHLFNHTEEL